MDHVQTVSRALRLFNDNFELVQSAVTNVDTAARGLSALRAKRQQKRRERSLLKMIAELTPSHELKGYVAEVDGLSDAELKWLAASSHTLQHRSETPNAASALTLCGPTVARNAVMFILRHEDFVRKVEAVAHACGAPTHGLHLAWNVMFDSFDSGDASMEEGGVVEHAPAVDGPAREACRMWDGTSARSDVPSISGLYRVCYIRFVRDDINRAAFVGAVMEAVHKQETVTVKHGLIRVDPWITSGTTDIATLMFDSAKDFSSLRVLANFWRTTDAMLPIDDRKLQLSAALHVVQHVYSIAAQVASGDLPVADLIMKPQLADLQDAAGSNKKNTVERIFRTFCVSSNALDVPEDCALDSGPAASVGQPLRANHVCVNALDAFVAMDMCSAVECVLQRYRVKRGKEIATDADRDGEAGIFASYIYATQGDGRVVAKYRKIFQARKICFREGNSGTIVAVPFSNFVLMSTHGMRGRNVEYVNNQAFESARETRILFLPCMLMSLGLTRNERVCDVMHREMENNPMIVTDPFTSRLIDTLRSVLAHKTVDVSVLREHLEQTLGEAAPVVIRETVALLARLGSSVDSGSMHSASFYDVTASVLKYKPGSIKLVIPNGVPLDGIRGSWIARSELIYFPGGVSSEVVCAKVEKTQFVKKTAVKMSSDDDGVVGGITGELHLEVKIGNFSGGYEVLLFDAVAQ